MKIKFSKFEPTNTFLKLFGINGDKSVANQPGSEQTDDAYEYYYKRGNTYYFRDGDGNKITINYNDPPKELIRGNRYKIDATDNLRTNSDTGTV